MIVKLDAMSGSYSNFSNDDIGCRSSEVGRHLNTRHGYWSVFVRIEGEWVLVVNAFSCCFILEQGFIADRLNCKRTHPHLG